MTARAVSPGWWDFGTGDPVDFLVNFVAPWASFYADHTAVATVVAFGHLAGLVLGGGRAVVADLFALRAPTAEAFIDQGRLRFLAASHRDVLIGLSLTAATGLLLLAADLEHHAASRLYWAKMALVGLLLANGTLLRRNEAGLAVRSDRAWQATRRHAGISLACWFAIILLGKALVNS